MENLNFVSGLKNKEAVLRLRNSEKNIREMLRKRCYKHIHERRQKLFDTQRLGLNDQGQFNNETFAEIVRRELSDMSMTTLKYDNVIDIEDEEYQLMMQEYETMQQYNDEFIDKFIEDILKEEVICPICQVAPIQESSKGLICLGCELTLPSKLSIEELGLSIKQHLNVHDRNCDEQVNFTILPENDTNSLYLTCDSCAIFALIV